MIDAPPDRAALSLAPLGAAETGGPLAPPWSYLHGRHGSDIEAFCDTACDWVTIAHTLPGVHLDPAANAAFIVRAVNDYASGKKLIAELAAALEGCLQCGERLTWEAEQEAHVVLARAKLAAA